MPDIAIWPVCDHNCIMCSNPKDYKTTFKLYSFENIKLKIENYINGDFSQFIRFSNSENWNLTGGEPTLNPNYIEVLLYIRKKFPNSKISQLTHGDRFYDENFTKDILKVNNLHICFPIHGYNEDTHDKITQKKGSFKYLIKAINNVLKFKNNSQSLEIRIIIQKMNNIYFDKIIFLINKYFNNIDFITCVFIEYEGQAVDNLDKTKISYTEFFSKNEMNLLKWSNILGNKLRLYHFPLCVFKEKQLWKNTWRTLDKNEIVFSERCKLCKIKKYCMGFHDSYFDIIGNSDELNPIIDLTNVKIIYNNSNFKYNPILNVKNII